MGPPVGLESVDKISSTTGWIWTVFSGQDIPKPIVEDASFVDVRDIARVAVYGVDHGDKLDGERYLLANGVVSPQAAADVLREAYPDRRDVIKKGTPGEGYRPGFAYPEEKSIDGSKAVRATGQDYYPVEQTIRDTAKYLEKFL